VSLAQLGFNPQEKIASKSSFEKQLESYALHVVEDRPVSNRYSYYLKDGEIFIDSSYSNKLFLDPEERGGYSEHGIKKAVDLAIDNRGKLVFHYSPPGPVAFNKGTKYDLVEPYSEGQLYLFTSNSFNKVDCLAMSVGGAFESRILQTIFGREYVDNSPIDPIKKVRYYLENPMIKDMDIDSFLAYLEGVSYLEDYVVYKNVRGEEFRLSDVIGDMIFGWSGEIKTRIKINYEELYNLAVNKGVSYAYFQQLGAYHPLYQKGGEMILGGSCGGSSVSNHDLGLFNAYSFEQIFRTENFLQQIASPLSSIFRMIKSPLDIKDGNDGRDEDYECPDCGKIHKGEIIGSDRSTWRKECSCGHKFEC